MNDAFYMDLAKTVLSVNPPSNFKTLNVSNILQDAWTSSIQTVSNAGSVQFWKKANVLEHWTAKDLKKRVPNALKDSL